MTNYHFDAAAIESVTDACLTYLIGNPDELAKFMSHAGMDGDTLRKSIGSRSLAHGLLDYFAHNESALMAMAANAGITTERFMRIWSWHNPQQ